MSIFEPPERPFAAAISELTYGNPFLPIRMDRERRALGDDFQDLAPVWHRRQEPRQQQPNVIRIAEKVEALAAELLLRQARGGELAPGEARMYEDLMVYFLYTRYQENFFSLIEDPKSATRKVTFHAAFRRDAERYLAGCRKDRDLEPDHLFACFFQVRRAFHYCFHFILGGSMPAAKLRAAVWQSIFTNDVRRYRRVLYHRMGEFTTLITGPSGTGKELVARAVGLSRYLPFDQVSGTFQEDPEASFFPLNLSALSPTLIESELFGHAKGAFTGASGERAGWLEVCPPLGTVFLDELGEVDPTIQVKLLRVLQSRRFERLGETRTREFRGKIIAATNRDLGALIQAGEFREDLFYRLCSDQITTPSLAEQLAGSGTELRHLLELLARRILDQGDALQLAAEVADWIEEGGEDGSCPLGCDYPWPGNVRELEQCLRNVLIRGQYLPARSQQASGEEQIQALIRAGKVSAADLLAHYSTWVYHLTGSYQEAARRLGLDRRTVKAKVDPVLLASLQGGADR